MTDEQIEEQASQYANENWALFNHTDYKYGHTLAIDWFMKEGAEDED